MNKKTANRTEFFIAAFVYPVLSFIPFAIVTALSGKMPEAVLIFLLLASCVIILAAGINSWIVSVYRMRDLNQNPWWVLTCFIPVVGIITCIYMLFARSASEI